MDASELVGSLRNRLAEQDPTGRFPTSELLDYINESRRNISIKVRFPEIQIIGITNGQQEYTLPEDIIQVKRVYVAGQRCPRTSIPTMEGDAIGLYDQSGPSSTPQWKNAAWAFYPVSSDTGFNAPVPSPYFQGQRPEFYDRSGNIGFVPPPLGITSEIRVEGIGLAPDLLIGDTDKFPRYYKTAIVWGAVELAMFADSNSAGYQWAVPRAERAIGDLIDTLKNFYAPTGTRLLTYRSVWDPSSYGGISRRGPW